MRGGLTLIRTLVLLAAAGAAGAQSPEFDVSIRSVQYNARQEFVAPREYWYWSGYGETEIRPRFVVRPLNGRPILGSEPRVRLKRLIGASGENLLTGGVRARGGDQNSRGRTLYLVGASQEDDVPRGATYEDVLDRFNVAVRMPRLPSELALIEGELTVEVVTEDQMREYALAPAGLDVQAGPGVFLRMWPRQAAGRGMHVSYRIDPAKTEGRSPILNTVRYRFGQQTDAVWFRPQTFEDGSIGGTGAIYIDNPATVRQTVVAHVVYETRRVTLPFRLEHVPITKCVEGAHATRLPGLAQSLEMVTSKDGYDVRVVRLLVGGDQATSEKATTRPAMLQMHLGVLDTIGTRPLGRLATCVLEEMTDMHGRAVARLGSQRVTVSQRTSANYRGLRRPMLDLGRGPNPERGRARMMMVDVPMDVVPPRLGTLRGRVEFPEIIRELDERVPLQQGAQTIELGSGVRVVVRKQVARTDVFPVQPHAEWVELEVDLSEAADPRRDASEPALDIMQFIEANGVEHPPRDGPSGRRVGNRMVYTLGDQAFGEKAAWMRVRVALETRSRSIPFEFRDVPCAEK